MLERIREYIEAVHWREATTMRRFAPHEYTIRGWMPEREGDFVLFAEFIRREGYTLLWRGRPFTCYDVDGYRYWTMGDPIDQTIVLNRARNT